jgi:hypothetical protein
LQFRLVQQSPPGGNLHRRKLKNTPSVALELGQHPALAQQALRVKGKNQHWRVGYPLTAPAPSCF